MHLKVYQIDAFSNRLFRGNPAAVCPLEDWLDEELMQKIASENNLSETAFFVPDGDGFDIKWFTPSTEVNLCGHATLASAHVLWQHESYQGDTIHFGSKSGFLAVSRKEKQYMLDFPSDELKETELPSAIIAALGVQTQEIYQGREDYLIVVGSRQEVEQLSPDFQQLSRIKTRGFIITAPGREVDFVSRCFFPNAGINEDPVTGSAHTTLTPYWANRLGKDELSARQISARGGELSCRYLGNRTLIGGEATTFMTGTIHL